MLRILTSNLILTLFSHLQASGDCPSSRISSSIDLLCVEGNKGFQDLKIPVANNMTIILQTELDLPHSLKAGLSRLSNLGSPNTIT